MTDVGDLLRRFRAEAGLSGREAARRGGWRAASAFLTVEDGRHLPRPDRLARLADALGLGSAERAALDAALARDEAAAPAPGRRRRASRAGHLVCARCKRERPEAEFREVRSRPGGPARRDSYCGRCEGIVKGLVSDRRLRTDPASRERERERGRARRARLARRRRSERAWAAAVIRGDVAALVAAGWSLGAIADAVGCSRRALREWVDGSVTPCASTAAKYHIPLRELLASPTRPHPALAAPREMPVAGRSR